MTWTLFVNELIPMSGMPLWTFLVGVMSLLLAGAAFVWVYGHRLFALKHTRSEQAFHRRWNPLMQAACKGPVAKILPDLYRYEYVLFLHLWVTYQNTVLTGPRSHLNRLAVQVGLVSKLPKLLKHPSYQIRLLATSAIGYLGLAAHWPALVRMVGSKNIIESLIAARALVHIDAHRAIQQVIIPMMVRRVDWPSTRLGLVLSEAGRDVLSKPLAQAALLANTKNQPRLLRFLELAHRSEARPILIRLLKASRNENVLTACLQVLTRYADPVDAAVFRVFIKHPNWRVRLKAIIGLGQTGTPEDVSRLLPQLRHTEWWVRYRTAQAIAGLPGVTKGQLEYLKNQVVTDRFAKDILGHVMAEIEAKSYRSKETTGMALPEGLQRRSLIQPFQPIRVSQVRRS